MFSASSAMFSKSNRADWRQYQAVLTLYLGTVIFGCNMGFSSVAIPAIQGEVANNQTYQIPSIVADQEQLSWFASCVNLGQLLGALLGGYLGSLIGPRKTIQLFGGVGVVGWILVSLAPHLSILILGRVVAGVASGSINANTSLLVAQYASDKRRGPFLALFTLMTSAGITLVYVLGAFLYWRIVAAIPAAMSLCMVVALFLVPESPIWILGHRGEAETRKALAWLRGYQDQISMNERPGLRTNQDDVSTRLGDEDDISNQLKELKNTQEKNSGSIGLVEALQNCSRPDIYKPVSLIIVHFILAMLAGPFAIVFYAVDVFKEAGLDGHEHLAAILIGVIRIISGCVAIFLIHQFSRRSLASLTFLLMGSCMAGLGAIMYIQSQGGHSSALRVLSVMCTIMYMLAFGLGVGPLQWVFLGELMPPEYKVLSGVAVSVYNLAIFLVTKFFPTLLLVMQPHGTYWLFSGVCILGILFHSTLMPDTKGKSMQEIRQIFHNK